MCLYPYGVKRKIASSFEAEIKIEEIYLERKRKYIERRKLPLNLFMFSEIQKIPLLSNKNEDFFYKTKEVNQNRIKTGLLGK